MIEAINSKVDAKTERAEKERNIYNWLKYASHSIF
jgi:hypothetical protein